MASTLKQALGSSKPQQPNMNTLFSEFSKNPMEYLLKAKLNIPENLAKNPQAMVQHLMQTGQIPRQLIPRIQQMFRR